MQTKSDLSSKTWVEISKSNLLHNFNIFKKLVKPKVRIMCVVKANAYGHGMVEVVKILKNKADWFGVDSLEEALEIRSMSVENRVLVLGYIPLENLKKTIESEISFIVYDTETLTNIESLDVEKNARLHIKIESGLNRQGVGEKDALKLAKKITKSKKMVLEGASTHFANIEDTLDPSFAMKQLGEFKNVVGRLRKFSDELIAHSAASAAAVLYPETHFDMVRVGISLYGLWPSKETRTESKIRKRNTLKLRPVFEWKSVVAQVKNVGVGQSVGYGRTWFTSRKSKIAIVPVGYYDGYDRKLSNNSQVIIREQFAPVVGRIAMNMTMVDVTDLKGVKKGDEVVLIGKSGSKEISVEYLADKVGTINYEVVSRINPNILRVVV